MNLSTRVLGTSTVNALHDRVAAVVLKIGADSFTRADLAAVECFNFTAAANLSRCLKELAVKNTRDLYETVPPTALALPHLGAISLAVLGAAFEKKHVGGDAPLETWVTKHHRADDRRAFVTFSTIKARDAAERAGERRDRKRRKHARRNEAHRLRVVRHTTRLGKTA